MSDGERAGSPVLELHDVAVYFGGRKGLLDRERPVIRAVNGVSLTIGRAETVALVGESGCGKSTLSNAIVGLEPVQPGGSIRIGGDEVTGASRRALRDIRRRVQMIFQDPALSLDPRATIGAAIAEPLLVRGVARGAALKARVARLLRQVGLRPEFASRYPHQFSGGQRQRVVIARALALEPDLVICDEPVSALDVSVRAQILNLLVELQRRTGVSYLFVSHDLGVVRHIADRVVVMYLGRFVEIAERDIGVRLAHLGRPAAALDTPDLGFFQRLGRIVAAHGDAGLVAHALCVAHIVLGRCRHGAQGEKEGAQDQTRQHGNILRRQTPPR